MWLLSQGAALLTPGPGYWPILRTLLGAVLPVGTDVFDSQIAALCQEHGIDPLTLPEARPLLM